MCAWWPVHVALAAYQQFSMQKKRLLRSALLFCVLTKYIIFTGKEVLSGHTGKTTYLPLVMWSICFGLVMSHIVCHVPIHFSPLCDIHVLLLHSPSSVPGLSKWCLSHLEKWRQPASGCHSSRLWKHDLDQRAQKLHLQRRWCVF